MAICGIIHGFHMGSMDSMVESVDSIMGSVDSMVWNPRIRWIHGFDEHYARESADSINPRILTSNPRIP